MATVRMLSAIALLLLAAILPAFGDDETPKDVSIPGLFKSGALFDAKQYPAVRAAFSKAFQEKHAATIRAAFGYDFDALSSWLGKHPGIRDELFTAIEATD